MLTSSDAVPRDTRTVLTDPLKRRILAEYREMPGMTLLPAQAARLWAIDRRRVEPLLEQLRAGGLLVRNAHGAYLRPGCPRCS